LNASAVQHTAANVFVGEIRVETGFGVIFDIYIVIDLELR
jgi:hypothetical protein